MTAETAMQDGGARRDGALSMRQRIAIGGLFHETNTYVKEPTTLGDFEVRRGPEVERHFAGTRTAVGGMLAAARDCGLEVAPLLHAFAEPSGMIAGACYDRLVGELVDALAAIGPVDLVALDLHGAGVALGVEDVEADICRRVRRILPDSAVVVATLDLHGNITGAMAEQLDVALACREYPHTDFYTRGAEGVRLAARLAAEGRRSKIYVERLPLLIGAGPKACTQDPSPASGMRDLSLQLSGRDGVLDCSVFHGFVPSDVEFAGAAIMVTDDGGGAGRDVAREAAAQLWSRRRDFEDDLPSPAEAVERALRAPGGPIILNDIADNPGGGAPGDCTRLLGAMLDAGVEHGCLGVMFDPEAVELAAAAGVGASVDLNLGGKRSPLHGPPLNVHAQIRGISDGRFKLRAMWEGIEVEMGRMARLQIGGVDVLVGSRRHQVFDPEVFFLNGVDVARLELVGVKSAVHFRAGFASVAAGIISSNSSGLSSARVADFPRRSLRTAVYPLDRSATYPSR